MNIIGLLPSEIRRLRDEPRTPKLHAELLAEISKLVSQTYSRDESVYLSARNLTAAGVWDFITAEDLAGVIKQKTPAAQDFVSGMPSELAGRVLLMSFQAEQNVEIIPYVRVLDPGERVNPRLFLQKISEPEVIYREQSADDTYSFPILGQPRKRGSGKSASLMEVAMKRRAKIRELKRSRRIAKPKKHSMHADDRKELD